jgi:hypothetical protein
MWIFDPEQSDNAQSPWDVMESKHHRLWCSKNPTLAQLTHPRLKRDFLTTTNAFEALPESAELEASLGEQEIIKRVIKRLTSNEASGFFTHPVPASEVEYHKQIESPTCLLYIVQRAQAGEYATYAAFQSEVDLMVSNAIIFAPDDSQDLVLSQIMQKDVADAKEEMVGLGYGHLFDD